MTLHDPIFSFFLISQLCVGVTGNSLLFVVHVHTFLIQPHLKKPIDPIFMHLSIVNILSIMCALIPNIMSSFGVQHFFDDVGCKAIMYISRVIRGFCICTTSLLSTFQAIIISPSNSKSAWLKHKLPTLIFPSFLFFWLINMLIYVVNIVKVEAKRNFTIFGHGFSHAYCQTRQTADDESWKFVFLILFRDLVFVVLMMWTSLYMVCLLYRHNRRAQHVHSSSLSAQPSPENRATYSILLLVCCFVFFYCTNNFFSFYSIYTPQKMPTLEVIAGSLSASYPTFCPFVLLKNNKFFSKFTSSNSMMRITCYQGVFIS